MQTIAALPCWSGAVDIDALPGGLSNRNFLRDQRRQSFVVRIGHDVPERGVMRFNEPAAARGVTAPRRAALPPQP